MDPRFRNLMRSQKHKSIDQLNRLMTEYFYDCKKNQNCSTSCFFLCFLKYGFESYWKIAREKNTKLSLNPCLLFFWDFLQNCCVKQFCKNWDLLFLTPSWSFLQEKRCKWLVSKDKKLWAPLISCFFSCVNRLGQKFGILHQHPCKPLGVFGEV